MVIGSNTSKNKNAKLLRVIKDYYIIVAGGETMAELEMEKLYSLQQVAEITGVKVSNLRYWANLGQIRAKKYGRAWMMSGANVQYFLDHGTEEKPQG